MHYLFTTLPTNDLGLLARALPVARELARAGHRVTFSHPAPPRRVIADAGFANVDQHHPLFDMVAGGDPSLRGLARLLADRGWPRHGLSRRAFLARLVPALPGAARHPPPTSRAWTMPPPRWGCSTGASSGPRAPHWPTSSTGRGRTPSSTSGTRSP